MHQSIPIKKDVLPPFQIINHFKNLESQSILSLIKITEKNTKIYEKRGFLNHLPFCNVKKMTAP